MATRAGYRWTSVRWRRREVFGIAVLVAIRPRLWPPPWKLSRVLDFLSGVGDEAADAPAGGSAFSGLGAFPLPEQGQQQEDDAPHALLDGVDRRWVCQRTHAD